MFKVGQRYRIYKTGALELKDKKWINAVVEHIPEHERFIRFRLHFVNMFGDHTEKCKPNGQLHEKTEDISKESDYR